MFMRLSATGILENGKRVRLGSETAIGCNRRAAQEFRNDLRKVVEQAMLKDGGYITIGNTTTNLSKVTAIKLKAFII